MRTDRGVDAHRAVELFRTDDLVIEPFAHAMQALEFVTLSREFGAGIGVDAGQSLGVMGGELRKDRVGCVEQLPRTGDIGDVCVELARIDRKIALTVCLRAFDLAVPISAFDQSDHDSVLTAVGEIDDPVQYERRALLVGLNDEPYAFPVFQRLVEAKGLQQIEGKFETIGFFGVNIETDIVGAGEFGQCGDAG